MRVTCSCFTESKLHEHHFVIRPRVREISDRVDVSWGFFGVILGLRCESQIPFTVAVQDYA